MFAASDATSHWVSSSIKFSADESEAARCVELPNAIHPSLHLTKQCAFRKFIDDRPDLLEIAHRLGTRVGENACESYRACKDQIQSGQPVSSRSYFRRVISVHSLCLRHWFAQASCHKWIFGQPREPMAGCG